MAEHICPNCTKPYQSGDEVCRYCGSMLPFSTAVLTPGKVLRQRYEIQGLAHSGGMGYIYLAKDKNLYDRICVVKQMKEPVKSDTDRKRLEEEALRMSKLSHSNAAMILDQFVEGGYYFLVVQHISGKTLSQVLEDRHGQLTEEDVLSWAISMCDVVSYLHGKGVIHRDISPENIMLTDEGTIMFIDFGTMRELRQITSQKTAGIGKFGFTPPEQWQGRPVAQSDIFAIGATVYYLLTEYLPLSAEYQRGQKPQASDFRPSFPPIRQKNPAVSQELEAVLQKAVQLDVNSRYQSAAELGQTLRNLKKAEAQIESPVTVGVKRDDSITITPVESTKTVPGQGWFKAGVALLVIGLLNTGLGLASQFFIEEDVAMITIVCSLLFILPFMIPGVLCLRRGLAQAPSPTLAKGRIPNWWWSLPALLGFIGGIISWLKQKEVDRRKAMSMLTWGIIVTIAWPTFTSAIPFLWLEPIPPPVLSVDRHYIEFSDLKPDSGMVYESVAVVNTGGGILTGKVTSTKDWLDASPGQIEVTDDAQEIKVRVDTAGLSHGETYTGYVNIDSTETEGAGEQIQVTLTTSAEPTATTATEASGVIFEDDFSDPNSGWYVGSDEEGERRYEDGGYRLVVTKAQRIKGGGNLRIGELGDFSLEVDAKSIVADRYSYYGVLFRKRGNEFYTFAIRSGDGSYQMDAQTYVIWKYEDAEWHALKNWTHSNYIEKGTSPNRLKVTCSGAQITVYVNGHKLATVTDDSLGWGVVALACGTGSSGKADVLLDNLKIYAPD